MVCLECDRETSVMRTPSPTGACCAVDNVVLFGLICSTLSALIISVQFSKEPKSAFGLMKVILFPSNYRYVSATQVAIFRVSRTKIQIQLLCVEITPEIIIIGF